MSYASRSLSFFSLPLIMRIVGNSLPSFDIVLMVSRASVIGVEGSRALRNQLAYRPGQPLANTAGSALPHDGVIVPLLCLLSSALSPDAKQFAFAGYACPCDLLLTGAVVPQPLPPGHRATVLRPGR